MPKRKRLTKRAVIREERKKARGDTISGNVQERRRADADNDAEEPLIQEYQPQEFEDVDDDFLENGYQAEEPVETLERPFYGLLQDEEQEYFRRADELLEMNEFPSSEERSLFLANVYKEAENKELKVACSQSCSRLMERLILLSSTEQKKMLFEKFMGNWTHLIQHRFASHCCEALFVHSGSAVEKEMGGKGVEGEYSMQELFLRTLDEIEPSIPTLLTMKFASHSLRALLVVLSGRPLGLSSSLLQSKKKENNTISGYDAGQDGEPRNRTVPPSFTHAIRKIVSDIIHSMEPTFIRVLTTHPKGNPILQLLLELELTASKFRKPTDEEPTQDSTLLSVLLPDHLSAPGSESEILLNNLLYDPVGSHLLEVLLQYAPSKLFKSIYTSVLLPKITSLARNDIACYPLIRALSRLSREDLQSAISALLPSIPDLVTKQRTIVIKILFERCLVRSADASELTSALQIAYGSSLSSLIQNMLSLDPSTIVIPSTRTATEFEQNLQVYTAPAVSAQQTHASLLAQAVLALPGSARELIVNSILSLDATTLLRFSLYPPSSRIIQAFLNPSSSLDLESTTCCRKVLNTLLSPLPLALASPSTHPSSSNATTQALTAIHILALHPMGSFVLESIYRLSTSPLYASLFVFAERIVTILAATEQSMQSTGAGRKLWKGWGVGTWKWDKERWARNIRTGRAAEAASIAERLVVDAGKEEEGESKRSKKGKKMEIKSAIEILSFKGATENLAIEQARGGFAGKTKTGSVNEARDDQTGGRKKTGIELARERFAAEKSNRSAPSPGRRPQLVRKPVAVEGF